MDIHDDWPAIRRIFGNSFSSSLHYAVSTVSEHGEPHVTPIGSLILGAPGHGVYFEEFPSRLPDNLERHPRLCVLAVNSGSWYGSASRSDRRGDRSLAETGQAGSLHERPQADVAKHARRARYSVRQGRFGSHWDDDRSLKGRSWFDPDVRSRETSRRRAGPVCGSPQDRSACRRCSSQSRVVSA